MEIFQGKLYWEKKKCLNCWPEHINIKHWAYPIRINNICPFWKRFDTPWGISLANYNMKKKTTSYTRCSLDGGLVKVCKLNFSRMASLLVMSSHVFIMLKIGQIKTNRSTQKYDSYDVMSECFYWNYVLVSILLKMWSKSFGSH